MSDPVATIQFLSSSENRVRLLEALAGEPRTRAEVHEETGIARATLGRILTDFDERGWVQEAGGRYEATPEAVCLIEEYRSLLDSVAALEELGDLVQWFPFEEVSFDLACLCDARITRTSKQDALRPMTRSLSLMRDADRISLVASQHAPPALEAMWEATVEEQRQRLDLVLSDGVVDSVLDADADTRYLREIVASERATVYRTDRSLGFNCVANDETILFALSDDNGAPQALVESDDGAVQDWYASFFQRERAAGTRLAVEDLPDTGPVTQDD